MTVIKIIAFILGIAFTAFGYFILFKGKYALINGFQAGRKDENDAKRVGIVEFVVGIALLAVFLILILFA